jgi:zinc protease
MSPTKRTRFLSLFLGAIAAVALLGVWLNPLPAQATPARHYTELTYPPLPEIKLPDYTRFELPNGLVVYLVEDHELPLVGGTTMIRTGSRWEPGDEVGLASIVGSVMRTGGTATRSGDELNALLERRAASVETGIDVGVGSAGFSALSEDLEEVFTIFADVLRNPAFPEDKIELVKTQFKGGIARRNDDPDGITGREFQKLIYGADSPYARTVEYATLNKISREDVIAFHQKYFHPNNVLMGIVGDFDSQKMRALIERTLGNWPANPNVKKPDFAPLPPVTQAKKGIFLVDQPNLTQSYIQMGHLGGRLIDPDYTPLTVMNEVLNNFGGRLVNEVRSRQGLAYVVYGFWSPRFDYPGLFVGGGQTRTETTVPFIKSMLSEIQKVRTTPVTDAELKLAKESVLNGFIFNFQTPAQTMSRLMRYEYYDYPMDFIFRYRREVEATTPADIQRAAQRYLKPEDLAILVVGNNAGIKPGLETIAPGMKVTPVDITIPQ